jgi:hypothetical protein
MQTLSTPKKKEPACNGKKFWSLCGFVIIRFRNKNTDVFETGIIALNLCLETLARSISFFFNYLERKRISSCNTGTVVAASSIIF